MKRDWRLRQGPCPLAGQCQQTNVIYGASIKTLDIMGAPVEESEETYTGTSYPPWKIRWYRHNTTFNNPALRHHTTLADYVWDFQCPDKCYQRGEEEFEQSIDYEITSKSPWIQPCHWNVPLVLKGVLFNIIPPRNC